MEKVILKSGDDVKVLGRNFMRSGTGFITAQIIELRQTVCVVRITDRDSIYLGHQVPVVYDDIIK